MSDRFREIETFITVVESANFSAAARKLDCTPSAVSKLIERLESRMGARLLQRTTRRITLTQEGKAFHQAATHVMDSLREAEDAISEAGSRARGTLKVHTTLAFAEQQLAPNLPEFLQRNPMVRVEFLLTSDPVDLVQEDVDISIQVGDVRHESMVAKRIGTARWVICASPAYLQKRGTPLGPEDLQDHDCLNFLAHSPRSHWRLGTRGQIYEPAINGPLAANSDNFLRVLARQGMGIARLADFHVGRDIREGRLVPLLAEWQLEEPLPIFAVLPSNRLISARVQVFLRFLELRLDLSAAFERPSRSSRAKRN